MVVDRIECWVFRAPVAQPVKSAVGDFSNRPALFVRLTDDEGARGWGEVFCNFPQVGAEHRARLIDSLVAPLARGMPLDDPASLQEALQSRLRRLIIQCGEYGPFAQVLGALDQAAWDLHARRLGVPLWRALSGSRSGEARVRPYASGLGPEKVGELARRKRDEGFRAFKLKVGFGNEVDLANLRELRAAVGEDAPIMLDANQAWTEAEARERLRRLAEDGPPLWIEEPMAADEPLSSWRALADGVGMDLAAGENIRGLRDFEAALANGHLRYVQPDVGKWGGLTGALAVGRMAQAHGALLCPHWLGGGVGLAASLHVCAALGADGWAEVDANPNPLRERVFGAMPLSEGRYLMPERPGLGIEPDLDALAPLRVAH